MWKILCWLCAGLCIHVPTYAVTVTAPHVNFGTVGYLSNGAGFQKVAVADNGMVSTSGSENLQSQTGGSAGETTLSFSLMEGVGSTVYFTTDKNLSYSITTPGCGTIIINNITTTNGSESASQRRMLFDLSMSFPVGADMVVSTVSSNATCTVSGTVSGNLKYRVGNGSQNNVNLNVSVTITPHVALEHASGAVLNFGTLCTTTTQTQTLTVLPNGNVQSSNLLCPPSADISADVFTVFAPVSTTYTVNTPASATLFSGGNSLQVSGFTSSCNPSCTLPQENGSFTVGATLTLPPNTPVGTYTGAYTVSITY